MAKCASGFCHRDKAGEIDTVVFRRGFYYCAKCAATFDRKESREERTLEILEEILSEMPRWDTCVNVQISGIDNGVEIPTYERRY